MTTLEQRPLSKPELEAMIQYDLTMATMQKPDGSYIVRNAEARREYEIRAHAMQYMLDNVGWIVPGE